MISKGSYAADMADVAYLLHDRKLVKEQNAMKRVHLGASTLMGLDYTEQWKMISSSNDYDYKLIDDSLLSFQITYGDESSFSVRYLWLECPRSAISYDDFAERYLCEVFNSEGGGTLTEKEAADLRIEAAEEIREKYAEYLEELPLKQHVTPLRYEYHPQGYGNGWHPASHFHIGQNYDIRISCLHVLTPFAFVMFLLRQVYCEHWRELIDSQWIMLNKHRARHATAIPNIFNSHIDQVELRLT